MATSTLVQYLEASGVSVSGAVQYFGTNPSDRLQNETFLTETAITKGQLVAVDVSKMGTDASGGLTALTVVAGDFNSVPVQKVVVGVAAESVTGTATSPQPVKVVVRGIASSVPVIGATAVGSPLCLDEAGAAGAAEVYTAAKVGHVLGYALTSTAGPGTVTAYILGCGI